LDYSVSVARFALSNCVNEAADGVMQSQIFRGNTANVPSIATVEVYAMATGKMKSLVRGETR
jgi:hypothetical protein